MYREAEYMIFTFHNTHGAIRCERVLDEAGTPVKVLSLPAQIGADCSLCARIPAHTLKHARALLDGAGVKYKDIYALADGEYFPVT